MAKYKPTDIPPGETKRICDMTATEYRSWRGRCGGKSTSKAKLRSQKRAAKSKKPGLSRYHATVSLIAKDGYETVTEVMLLGDDDYKIDKAKALQLLAAARKYHERNRIQ